MMRVVAIKLDETAHLKLHRESVRQQTKLGKPGKHVAEVTATSLARDAVYKYIAGLPK
jgi:hypothetical protein